MEPEFLGYRLEILLLEVYPAMVEPRSMKVMTQPQGRGWQEQDIEPNKWTGTQERAVILQED